MIAMSDETRKRAVSGAALCSLAAMLLFVAFAQTKDGPLPEDDDNPHFWKYAYVIVTYHKMGHQLSHVLRGYIEQHMKAFGGRIRRKYASPREDYDEETKCSDLSFGPGTVTIVEAPEFHCTPEQLAELLMKNPNPKQAKWGVKMIHLVRDPFSMAVSNYHFHSLDPTPEPYVHWKDPCLLSNEYTGPVADLVAPLLSDPNLDLPGEGNVPGGGAVDERWRLLLDEHHRGYERGVNGALPPRAPIMTRDDFGAIIDDCNSLYRTGPNLVNASYYEHLRTLPSRKGLRMATADKFSHIALMASDLLMFHRVRRLEQERSSRFPDRHRQLNLITMPMEDWIHRPGESMHHFLEFIFGDHLPDYKKNNISRRYEKGFAKKRQESSHITTGKYKDTEALMEYLREDPVFGGPLARIEALLDDVLRLQSMQE